MVFTSTANKLYSINPCTCESFQVTRIHFSCRVARNYDTGHRSSGIVDFSYSFAFEFFITATQTTNF